MKCDELETEQWLDYGGEPMPCYPAKDVDAAIAELKAENERLVKCCKEYDSRQRIDERIKSGYAQQLRATKREMWLAKAECAKYKSSFYFLVGRYDDSATCDEEERTCRAKAEEYK